MPSHTSKTTFKEELADIGTIPGVMDTQRINDDTDAYPEEIGQYEPWIFEERGLPEPSYDDRRSLPADSFPIGRHRAMPIQGTIIEGILKGETEILEGLLEDLRGRGFDPTTSGPGVVARRVAVFGSGAFASYLPWHIYALSKRTPWGIYLFAEPLLLWGYELTKTAKACGHNFTYEQGLSLAVQAAYRHELFHYHVERFAIRSEVLGRRPVYLPYRANVFIPNRNTPDWLEEALAQAVVLKSRMVAKRVYRLPAKQWKKVLHQEFSKFGAGYRDHECKHVGGVDNAHALLAAQIETASCTPGFSSTTQFTPRSECGTPDKQVPGYIMATPNLLSQFQLAGPNKRNWDRFAKANGISPQTPSGVGDHKQVRLGRQKVQINYNRNGEMDLASLRAAKKVLGFDGSLRSFIQQIRSA
jgi:hypothetical protein